MGVREREESKVKLCSWCGTNLRGRQSCPRGPACEQEERNHHKMMAVIHAQDKKIRRKA